MNTYAWKINTLEHELSDGFVFTAHYSVTAISDVLDPEGNPYNSGAYGSIGLERPKSLIPYDQLTEEQVIQWVRDKLTEEKVTEIEQQLDAVIAEKRAPTKASGVPW